MMGADMKAGGGRGYKKKLIIAATILVSVFLAGYYLYVTNSRVIYLPQEITCRIKGHRWDVCNGTNVWENMFCGCFVEMSDKGKACAGSKDCLSKLCVITYNNQEPTDGKYTGTCVTSVAEKDYDSGKTPEVICGNAAIEEGKIVEDKRTCVY
jgi:hypothetical protein